jgi:NADH-quinone oxidoreductase subunit N
MSANSLLTAVPGRRTDVVVLYALVAFDRDSGRAAEAAIKYFVLGAHCIGHAALRHVDASMASPAACISMYSPARHARLPDGGLIIRCGLHHRGCDRVQIRRRAVSHVGARRVPGISDQRDSVHRHGLRSLGSHLRSSMRLVARGHDRSRRTSGHRCSWCRGAVAVAIGNVAAIAQSNLKRMLAYSAIANAGFILLGFATGQSSGYQAALNFTIGLCDRRRPWLVFGMILLLVAPRASSTMRFADFKGLSRAAPCSQAADGWR